jgi:hypothetical protein
VKELPASGSVALSVPTSALAPAFSAMNYSDENREQGNRKTLFKTKPHSMPLSKRVPKTASKKASQLPRKRYPTKVKKQVELTPITTSAKTKEPKTSWTSTITMLEKDDKISLRKTENVSNQLFIYTSLSNTFIFRS